MKNPSFIPFVMLLFFSLFLTVSPAFANSEYYLSGPPQKIWDYVSGSGTPSQGGGGSGQINGADGGGNHYNPDSNSWIRPHVADPNENCENIQIELVEHHVLGNKRSQWPLHLPGEYDSNNIFHVYGKWRHPSAHPHAGSSTTQHFEIKEGQYRCIPDKGQGHIGQTFEKVKPKGNEFISSEITVNEHKETGASVTLSSSAYHVGLNGQITLTIPPAPGVSGSGTVTAGAGTRGQTTRVGTTTEVYYDPPVEQKIITYTAVPPDWQLSIVNPTFMLLPNEKRDVELNTITPSSGAVLLSIQTTSENKTLISPPFVVIVNKNNDIFTTSEVDVGNNSTMFVFHKITKSSTISDLTIENNQVVKLNINPSRGGILQVRLPTIVIPDLSSVIIEQIDVNNNTNTIQPTSIDENQLYTTFTIPVAVNTKDVVISGVDANDIEQKEMLLFQNPNVIPEFGNFSFMILTILIVISVFSTRLIKIRNNRIHI